MNHNVLFDSDVAQFNKCDLMTFADTELFAKRV